MRRLSYSERALKDIDGITTYIADVSGERATAERFVATLLAKCSQIAALEATIGRLRNELKDLRSTSAGNYIIFFRYSGPSVEILRIIERHRDVSAQFDDDAT